MTATSTYSHRGWFWRCILMVAFLSLILTALRPAISYRALDIGLAVGWIGPLAATFNLVPLVLTVPAGRWMDNGGHRSAAILGSAVLLVATAAFIWSNSVVLLVLCSVLSGACTLVLSGAAQAMVAMYSPPERYDSRFAMISLAGSTGQVAGGGVVALMPSVIAGPAAAAIFAAAAGAAVVVALLAVGLRRPPEAGERGPRTRAAAQPSTIEILRSPGVTPAIVASLTVIASIDLMGIYLPVLGVQRGWTEATVGVLLTLRAATTMLARLALSPLSRKFGARRLFVVTVAASAVAIAVVPLGASLAWTAALLSIAGLMLGFGQPLSMSMVAHAAPEASRGTALSLRMSGNMVGVALLPVLVAPLVGAFGAGAVFFAAAAALGGVTGMLAVTKGAGR